MDGQEATSQTGDGSARYGGIRTSLILAVPALVFFIAGLLLFVRTELDGNTLVRAALPHLEHALNRKISFSSARLTWPGAFTPRLEISDLSFLDKPGGPLRLRIPTTVIEFRPAALFRGALTFERVRLLGPVLRVSAGSSSPGERGESRPAPPSSVSFFFSPLIKTLEIREGRVFVERGDGRTDRKSVVLCDVRIQARDATLTGIGDFSLHGRVPGDLTNAALEVSGRVDSWSLCKEHRRGRVRARLTDCPGNVVSLVAKSLGLDLPLEHGTFRAGLDMDGRSGDCRIRGEVSASGCRLLPGRFFLRPVPIDHAEAAFSADIKGDTLYLKLPRVSLPGLELSGEARVGRLSSGAGTTTISVRNAELDLERLFPLVPMNLLTTEDRDRLAAAGLKGHVSVKGAAWSGRLSDFRAGKLRGTVSVNALLEDVSGFIPGLGLPVKAASGRVRIGADEVLLSKISLTLGESPIVLNGAVTDMRSAEPLVDLFVSVKARAGDINPILRSRAVAWRLPRGLNRIEDPKGEIAVSLDLKGALSHPSVRGVAALDRFQCAVEGIPLRLTRIRGSFKFEGAGVTFKDLTGLVGSSRTKISGSLSPKRISLSATASVSPRDLRKLKLQPSDWRIRGTVPVTLKIEGPPGKTRFELNLDLKGNRLKGGWLFAKGAGTPLSLKATGLLGSTGVKIRDGRISLGRQRVGLSGSWDFGKKADLVFKLPKQGIRTETLMALVNPAFDLKPGGRIEGGISLASASGKLRDVAVDAELLANHVSLRVFGFYKPWRGLTGRIRLRGADFFMVLDRVRIGNSRFTGRCSVSGRRKPRIDVVLTAPFLDTTDFTAPEDSVSGQTWPEWIASNWAVRLLARGQGRGKLRVYKGRTSKRTFSDFKADLIAQGGRLKAPSWVMNFGDGKLRGSAVCDLVPGARTLLRTEFQGDHLKMQRVLQTNPEQVSVESDFLLEGNLAWHASKNRKNNGVYKTGRIEVRLRDGIIHKFDVLSKIFSLINLGSILSGRLPHVTSSGLPFNRLSWQMEVFDTKWKVKNLKLLSDAATIDAQGMYFSDQNRVDFSVDVSPLVGFDKIISGLFGNLITKDGKILTTTFRVRGLSHSPDVRLEPLRAFKSR
jgi:hypothetical protein